MPTTTEVPQTEAASTGAKGMKRQKILVPLDFSATSDQTLAHAIEIAQRTGAKMAVVHVVEVPWSLVNPGVMGVVQRTAGALEGVRDAAMASLATYGDRVRAAGLECAEEVRLGAPAEEVLQAAEEAGSDLIVLGHRGASAISRLLLGSTAERVVRHAPCSVLVVRA